jgi:hypothetical protein
MEVVRHGCVDLTPLLTHTFPLEKIADAYELFGERADGGLKVEIRPQDRVQLITATKVWLKKPFNEPAKQAERVLAPGDGEAKPGEPNRIHVSAHAVGDR